MVIIVETDDRITLEKQLDEDTGPIIVMNKFNVDPQEIDEFLQVFAKTTEMFKQQPGFISAQLHRGIANSTTFVNYVVWESAAHFKQAFNRPEFRSNMAKVLPNTVMSHICSRRLQSLGSVWINCIQISHIKNTSKYNQSREAWFDESLLLTHL